MTVRQEPGSQTRRSLLRRGVVAGVVMFAGTRVRHAAAETAQVTIDNFTFSPTPLMVSVGSTVTWVNEDDIPHSIYCAALNLKSKPLDTDDSYSYSFEKVGTYDYTCGLHPQMRGQVMVMA